MSRILLELADRADDQMGLFVVRLPKRMGAALRLTVEHADHTYNFRDAADIDLTADQVRALVGTLTDWLAGAAPKHTTPDREIP